MPCCTPSSCSEPALDTLATIVRGADTDRLALAPQAAGLLAVSLGLSRLHADDDHAMLAAAHAGVRRAVRVVPRGAGRNAQLARACDAVGGGRNEAPVTLSAKR